MGLPKTVMPPYDDDCSEETASAIEPARATVASAVDAQQEIADTWKAILAHIPWAKETAELKKELAMSLRDISAAHAEAYLDTLKTVHKHGLEIEPLDMDDESFLRLLDVEYHARLCNTISQFTGNLDVTGTQTVRKREGDLIGHGNMVGNTITDFGQAFMMPVVGNGIKISGCRKLPLATSN
ncbi:hypothetical protein MKEN_00204800 [Mycena kentingensis (nom. inval.)]|nr:hypothetical protein MKEN_00204800 [Mycena kentingensis (nom. inval.)]